MSTRMKYKRKDGAEFEFEGEPEQIWKLYQLVTGVSTQTSTTIEKEKPKKKTRFELPSDEAVETYIKSKPNYEHDLFEIQEHFFGRKFSSRGESASMYHRTSRQVRDIRKKIEKEESGKFKSEYVDGGVKRHIFEQKLGTYEVGD